MASKHHIVMIVLYHRLGETLGRRYDPMSDVSRSQAPLLLQELV